jgi:hypothetical protein
MDVTVVVPEWLLSWPVRLTVLLAVVLATYVIVRVVLGAKKPPDFPMQPPQGPVA